jgi:hypothetical protein
MLSRYTGAPGGSGDIESDSYQRPDNNMLIRFSGAGPTDNIESAIAEYQKVMAPKNKHPLENYLGSVSDQESYRPAILQYLANGGRLPQWHTGNYEVDQPNIEAAIASTMTPEQQMKRSEVQEKNKDLKEARNARIAIAQQTQKDKERMDAAKREGMLQALKPNREDRISAHNVLSGILGNDYLTVPKDTVDAISERIASRAKTAMSDPENKGVDYESLMQEEVNDMILNGELKMPDKGSFLGNISFGVLGKESQKTEFNPQGTSSQDWIARAQADPRNKGIPLEVIIAEGKKRGKIK